MVDSVVAADTVVRSGARVAWSIVDTGCTVEERATVGDPDVPALDDPDAVTVVGRDLGRGCRGAAQRPGVAWSPARPPEPRRRARW